MSLNWRALRLCVSPLVLVEHHSTDLAEGERHSPGLSTILIEPAMTTITSTLFAYLDPSSGSMGFQLLLAGLLSGMFFLRTMFSAVKQRLSSINIRLK